MRTRQFEALVRQALEELPVEFLSHLDNVDVVTERWPTRELLEEMGVRVNETLFGLYQGVPLTERAGYNLALPDKITIFQGPIEETCDTAEQVVYRVQETVIHEVAHFFGISDTQLEAWGLS